MSLNSDIIRFEEINEEESDPKWRQSPQTAHDWEVYKMSHVFDDGTITYFW